MAKAKIDRCRSIARGIGDEVAQVVETHSTVGTERGVLRLLGFNDALTREDLMYPVANLIVDQLAESGRLARGVLFWVASALLTRKYSLEELITAVSEGLVDFSQIEPGEEKAVYRLAEKLARDAHTRMMQIRQNRRKKFGKLKDPADEKRPLKYVIVATGNIFEDVLQAKAAVLDGADIIAVIRSTAQSLLDYVPHGHTTQGFGGTYSTQANFRLMREALDELSLESGRYVRLTNYCSGLCMSEIAALAAIEGLDCLLNDAMYGILFRDINMRRTLIDQHFSRLICSKAGIWIMTGEDNYMKTTDAKTSGDQVLASQFINERAAINAGMPSNQMAIGHAMEMDPSYDQVILMEIARAQMTRQIFPQSPLKYMCNTKYKTGDIFTSHAIDTIFNLLGGLTGQGVILLGMPTEAVHTPWLADRSMALRSANYVVGGSRGLADEVGYRSDGFIAKFAGKVLDDAVKLLERIRPIGLMKAIEKGTFAGVKRTQDGGKGGSGVFPVKRGEYLNPFFKLMGSRIGV